MWFDSFENFLVQYSFRFLTEGGSISVSNKQKAWILNIDETALSMEGTIQNRGELSIITFHDGSLLVLGSIASISLLTTMINGSNALGEVIPPHFQFSTTAKYAD